MGESVSLTKQIYEPITKTIICFGKPEDEIYLAFKYIYQLKSRISARRDATTDEISPGEEFVIEKSTELYSIEIYHKAPRSLLRRA